MRKSKLAIVVGIGIAAAVYAASTLFTYTRFNFATQSQETVTSNFDIPNASFTQSQASGVSRYEVKVPSTTALKNGEFLVQLVLGDPQSGMSNRVLYATFGQEARIGGDWPIEGTQAIVLNGNGDKVADATAVVEGDALVIEVATSDISNGSVLSATLFGQDAPLGLEKNQVPFWRNFATKTLISNWGEGTFVLPPIPGEDDQLPFEEAGLQSSQQNQPPPSIPNPRDITPKNWGPPTGRWQPNPPVPPAISTNFDNDGEPDFQLPGGDIVPGGGGIHFGSIVLDNECITFVVWTDGNGDGIIQRNECIGIVGQCVFEKGLNYSFVYKDSNNQRHIVVINKNDGSETHRSQLHERNPSQRRPHPKPNRQNRRDDHHRSHDFSSRVENIRLACIPNISAVTCGCNGTNPSHSFIGSLGTIWDRSCPERRADHEL